MRTEKIKGFVCGMLTTALVAGGAAFATGQWKTIDVLENDITVMVDGKQVTESNFVYNDTTYLPLRAVAEAVGKPVDYDAITNTAYIGEKPASTSTHIANYPNTLCPDYGAVTGLQLIKSDTLNDDGSLTMYMYLENQEQLNRYIDTIIAQNFQKGIMRGSDGTEIEAYKNGNNLIMFQNESGYLFVACYTNADSVDFTLSAVNPSVCVTEKDIQNYLNSTFGGSVAFSDSTLDKGTASFNVTTSSECNFTIMIYFDNPFIISGDEAAKNKLKAWIQSISDFLTQKYAGVTFRGYINQDHFKEFNWVNYNPENPQEFGFKFYPWNSYSF